jgi:1-deoxy-D-xylulose-5-phosphate synthase
MEKLDHGFKDRPIVLPDRFIDHASPHIVAAALAALGRPAGQARG